MSFFTLLAVKRFFTRNLFEAENNPTLSASNHTENGPYSAPTKHQVSQTLMGRSSKPSTKSMNRRAVDVRLLMPKSSGPKLSRLNKVSYKSIFLFTVLCSLVGTSIVGRFAKWFSIVIQNLREIILDKISENL